MRFYEITEARRNAKHPQQERITPAQTVLKYKDAGDDYFITFTDLPKVGFNPTSPYSTPLGVYCYPITPFAKRLKEYDDTETFTSKFPFASDRTYFFILRAKKPMVVAQKYNQKMYDTDLQKLKEITNRDDLHFEPDDKIKRTPFGLIWENLFQVSHYYPKSQVMWNKLMRLLGWYGVVDYGSGYIHENEPTQAFFISPDAYEVVEKYEIHSRGHMPIYYQKMKMATPRDKKMLIKFKNALKVSDFNKISSLLINMSANMRPTAYQIILDVIIKENRPLLISTLPSTIFLKFLEKNEDVVESHLKELVKYSYTVDGTSKMDKIYDDVPRDVMVKWVNKYDFYFDGMLNHGGTSYFAKKYYDRILDDVKNPKNKTPWKNIDVLAKAETKDFPIELASEQYKSLWPYLVKQFGQTDKKIPIDILLEVMYNDPNTTNLIDNTQIRIMTSDEKRKFAISYIDSVFRADEYVAGKFSYHTFPWFYFQDETINYIMNYLISKAKESLKNGKLTRNDVNMIKNDLEYIKQMLARIRMST